MIMKAVGMLRRETLRASRIDELNWEDGYDADKDGPLPSPPHVSSKSRPGPIRDAMTCPTQVALLISSHTLIAYAHSIADDDLSASVHHSTSASTETDPTPSQGHSSLSSNTDVQEHRHGIVEDITGVLLSWKKEQEDKAKKITASPIGGLGFIEGVVIGGLIVALMMRFSR